MRQALLILLSLFALAPTAHAAASIAPDWAGKEPTYPPGSLFYQTRNYPNCPVLYRTVLQVENRPIEFAGCQLQAEKFAYVFLNGRQIAAAPTQGGAFGVELTPLLRPGRNVLVVSAQGEGFALEGGIGYHGGRFQRFGADTRGWKAQKLPPLAVLEYEKCLEAGFDDAGWFAVREARRDPAQLSQAELQALCDRLAKERLDRLDTEGRWRLQMLATRGISVVDWDARGWGGPERLPAWVVQLAQPAPQDREPAPGTADRHAEALCRYVRLSDEATNLENQAAGLKALQAPAADVAACRDAAAAMRAALAPMAVALKAGKDDAALAQAAVAQAAADGARKGRLVNPLNRCLENKFGWFDTGALLENHPSHWGLEIATPASVFSSPLSPASLVSVRGTEFVLRGWDRLQPWKVYNKQTPSLGPVCLWAVLDGKVTGLKPGPDGAVYDRAANGKLGENWVLLVNDMARGGGLPVQMVFLQAPTRIAYKGGDKGTAEVTVTFDKPDAQFFLLRPLKEWRGFLEQARAMVKSPLVERETARYVEPCRLWSRALLNYPVTFSESFVRDPADPRALLVADVYNYREMQDEWGTKPVRLASLPPLASYGLMTNYPGLKVVGEAKEVGSWGIWGDHIAAVDQDRILYRVPLDPIKRFGGFTSYCFGDTDIGEPGGLTEIAEIKRTGANSFRPQHNSTGQRAIKTVQWCWEQGLQNVFNTDEKWVPDVVEHYRALAQACKDFPPDAVAYDLLNEPETRDPRAYGALMKKITNAIRQYDKTHLIYVESMPPWGPGAAPFPRGAFETLEPTGDPLTVYSFHDYEYRLPPHWPNDQNDVRDILARWIPAFRYAIDHRCAIHLGEFGGFEQTKQSVFDNPCALTMMRDYLDVFDQFGWHWHYYANRGVTRVRKDGSLQESYVQEACRRYFAGGTFNAFRRQ